jgi:hypothetical protein
MPADLQRTQKQPSLLVFDPRRYNRHRGRLLHADRVFLGGMWTPIVRIRARLPRASDGGTEI